MRRGSGLDWSTLGVENGDTLLGMYSLCGTFGNPFVLSLKNSSKKRDGSDKLWLELSDFGSECFDFLLEGVPSAFASDDEDDEKVMETGGGVGYALYGTACCITDCAKGVG